MSKSAESKPVGNGGTKRPLPAEEQPIPETPALDFMDLTCSSQLQLADLELVFCNGTLYANAAILVNSGQYFHELILQSWKRDRNEHNRLVIPFGNAEPRHYETLLPLLHLCYNQGSPYNTLKSIETLFDTPLLFDEFLTFIDGIIHPTLIEMTHRALEGRNSTRPDIYPILKKHSEYGKKPGLLRPGLGGNIPNATPNQCLEKSYMDCYAMTSLHVNFRNQEPRKQLSINMYRHNTDAEDIKFFHNLYCLPTCIIQSNHERLNRLRQLLLFNTESLISVMPTLNFVLWTNDEISDAAFYTKAYEIPLLMKAILEVMIQR
jgi:hypothetical protein